MKIDKIISLANNKVRLRFLAMERSLRATGCQLPLLVIPYDNDLFELPDGATWWKIEDICNLLDHENSHPMMRKYQCLTIKNYQFVDSDVCFLRNPEIVLSPFSGFVTSCGHWRDPQHTYTEESLLFFQKKSTMWPKLTFNAGQFACDRQLFSVPELLSAVMKPDCIETCIRFPFHDQPGLNLLVLKSEVPIINLTLPPVNMESTWAGDYINDSYQSYWVDEETKPYIIHWAGTNMNIPLPIHNVFYTFLSSDEKLMWDKQISEQFQIKSSQFYLNKALSNILLKKTLSFLRQLSRYRKM